VSRARARAVLMVVVALLASAAVIALAPVPAPGGAPAPAPAGAGSELEVVSIPDEPWDRGPYWEVVEGNVLSPSRQSPDPGGAPWTVVTATVEAPPAPRPTPTVPRYRLSGIVGGADGFVALIDADPRVPGAELYRVGDAVGPFRLIEANDSVVVLSGPGGTQRLRLETN
jgi:hypothetical protein